MKVINRTKEGYTVFVTNEEMHSLVAEGLDYAGNSKAPAPNDLINLNSVMTKVRSFNEQRNAKLSTKSPKATSQVTTESK